MGDAADDVVRAERGLEEADVVDAEYSTELVQSRGAPPATLFRTDDPVEIVSKATQVADALSDVLKKKGLTNRISNKDYVRVEGWTLCGTMLGVFPVVEWTRPVEGGWEARVEARTRDGSVVGAAEAECLRSESRWSNADDYSIRSMAQCVPLRAQILTRKGWRSFAEAAIGADVLAYDIESQETKWVELEAVNVFGPSEVIKMESRSFNVTCTPDHSWVVQAGAKKKSRRLVEAQNLRKGRSLVIAARCSEGEEILADLAATAGWLLTDGTIRQPQRGGTRMHIDQSKHVQAVRDALDSAHLAYTESVQQKPPRQFPGGNVSTLLPAHRFSLSAQAVRTLQALGLNSKSDGPRFAARLGPKARAAMLEAMLLADGSERSGRWRFGKTNKDVMETFQILATLQGRALGRLTGFTMVNGNHMPLQTLRVNNTVHSTHLRISDAPPEPVWCPTTPLGTWVMRLDGTITITGNTRAISKALRAPLGFIVALAGYETTPEEEMVRQEEKERPFDPDRDLLPGALRGEDAPARLNEALLGFDPSVDWQEVISAVVQSKYGKPSRRDLEGPQLQDFWRRLSNAVQWITEHAPAGDFPPVPKETLAEGFTFAFAPITFKVFYKEPVEPLQSEEPAPLGAEDARRVDEALAQDDVSFGED